MSKLWARIRRQTEGASGKYTGLSLKACNSYNKNRFSSDKGGGSFSFFFLLRFIKTTGPLSEFMTAVPVNWLFLAGCDYPGDWL